MGLFKIHNEAQKTELNTRVLQLASQEKILIYLYYIWGLFCDLSCILCCKIIEEIEAKE